MLNREYMQVTDQVQITVQPSIIEDQSKPEEGVFAFAYAIKIKNLGAEPIQLLERHWKVFSAEEQIAEVIGPGVVGQQPVIQPSGTFEYTSGAVINDPVGYMFGTYQFQAESGRFFRVEIPRFELIYTQMLH